MNLKRILSLILALTIVISMFAVVVMASDEIKVMLDGNKLVFDVLPQIIDGRTMVPMRKIFEEIGAEVLWDGDTKTITATKDDITVKMQIDNKVINVSGKDISLDVPPMLVDSRTLVPARAVAESFDLKVEWDDETKTVYISTPNKKLEEIYKYPDPKIDFSGDDGTMSKLHLQLRLPFEQQIFPQNIFFNKEILKEVIVDSPEEFLAFVDNDIWGGIMQNVIIQYMSESDEEYVIESEEDIFRYINEIADRYLLRAYQNYEVDAVKVSEDKYMILFSMADIYEELKVPEMDKMLLSSYLIVVYNKKTETTGYYLLERSIDGLYAVCSIDENGTHSTHEIIKKDKKAFVEAVIKITE